MEQSKTAITQGLFLGVIMWEECVEIIKEQPKTAITQALFLEPTMSEECVGITQQQSKPAITQALFLGVVVQLEECVDLVMKEQF